MAPAALQEEEKFKTMSRDPEVYKRIAKSIAPSIFGCEDIKKSIACLLFGGSTKVCKKGTAKTQIMFRTSSGKRRLLIFAFCLLHLNA